MGLDNASFISSGLKDTIMAVLAQIGLLMEFMYVQKMRISCYPAIEDEMNFFNAKEL